MPLYVTEIFRHGQSRQADAHTRSRRLVHLSVYQCCFFNNAGFFHFRPQVVAFTGTFADAAKDGHAAVFGGNIPDQFHDDNRLADAGAAEQTDFTTTGIRRNQVNDLDPCFQYLRAGRLVFQFRGRAVNRPMIFCFDLTRIVVDRIAQNIENTTQSSRSNRNLDRRPRVKGFHPPLQSISGGHGHAANGAVTQVLHDFSRNSDLYANVFAFDQNRIINSGKLLRQKFDVNNRSNNLYDMTSIIHKQPPT